MRPLTLEVLLENKENNMSKSPRNLRLHRERGSAPMSPARRKLVTSIKGRKKKIKRAKKLRPDLQSAEEKPLAMDRYDLQVLDKKEGKATQNRIRNVRTDAVKSGTGQKGATAALVAQGESPERAGNLARRRAGVYGTMYRGSR